MILLSSGSPACASFGEQVIRLVSATVVGVGSIVPLVSISTLIPAPDNARRIGSHAGWFWWSRGSPPLMITKSTSIAISCSVISAHVIRVPCSARLKRDASQVYAVSHHEQCRLQPINRRNPHRWPSVGPSPDTVGPKISDTTRDGSGVEGLTGGTPHTTSRSR